jgi:electron transfer flavoprotein beta subunit
MKILVCLSKSPDTTAKIRFTDDKKKFDEEGVEFIINPNDDFAIAKAVELKEEKDAEVTVINVGKKDTEQIIRKALAIGADQAIRVDAEPLDAYFVATQIAEHAKEEDYDLILTGRETINYNGAQVSGMLAEMLDLPYVSGSPGLNIKNGSAEVVREIEGGEQTVEIDMPCLISAQENIAEPKIPNMRGIMTARKKPLEVVEPKEVDKLTTVEYYDTPPPKGECKLVDPENIDEFIDLLHNDAKVI